MWCLSHDFRLQGAICAIWERIWGGVHPWRSASGDTMPGLSGGSQCYAPHCKDQLFPFSPHTQLLLTLSLASSIVTIRLEAKDTFKLHTWDQTFPKIPSIAFSLIPLFLLYPWSNHQRCLESCFRIIHYTNIVQMFSRLTSSVKHEKMHLQEGSQPFYQSKCDMGWLICFTHCGV